MKPCSKCGAVLPADTDHFHQRGGGGGLTADCKACRNRRTREWMHANRARKAAYQRAFRARQRFG